jgi:hypothetical protein
VKPREVLEELDRLGVTVWWLQYGGDSLAPGTRIESIGQVSPELRAAIDEHTETLLQIMTRRPGESPGLYFRPPGAGDAA